MSAIRVNIEPSSLSSPSAPPARLSAPGLLAWGAAGLLLYVAHTAFVPLALALLFALILSGPVEALHRHRVSRSLSATLILVIALGLMTGLVNLVWTPAQAWMTKAPQTMATIKQRIRPVAQFMNRVDELRRNAGTLSGAPHSRAAAAPVMPLVGTGPAESAPIVFLDATGSVLTALLTFVIVTLFLLAGGPPMLARMTAAFADDLHASHVLEVIEKVRAEVGRFYVTTAVINLTLGCATTLALMAWGMPTPYLWGALAALLNFIPYAGPATTLVIITLVAVVSFNPLGQVLGVAGSYVLIAMIEGQVIQPLLVGRRLEVNPLLIFLALWFGGLFWGIAGIVLATPALVALKVVSENTVSGQSIVRFLGPNNQSPEWDRKLQRLKRSLQ
jgi:predicted PurR-regulated permease PerM